LKKIVIFGVGLIGGSFALALKQAGAVAQVVGVGRTKNTLARALELGIVDVTSTSVADALVDADLVMIAAPVAQTGAILSAIAPYLQRGTVVTDSASSFPVILSPAAS
jgi:prephenate dehydrogenase